MNNLKESNIINKFNNLDNTIINMIGSDTSIKFNSYKRMNFNKFIKALNEIKEELNIKDIKQSDNYFQ